MSSPGNGEKEPTSPASPSNPPEVNLTLAPYTNPAHSPTQPNRNPETGTSSQAQRLVIPQGDRVHLPFNPPCRLTFPGYGPDNFVLPPNRQSSFRFSGRAIQVPFADVIGSSSREGVRVGQPNRVAFKRQTKNSAKAGVSGDVANGPFVNRCSVCERPFTTPKGLYIHMRMHRSRVSNAQPPPTLVVQEPIDLPGMNLRDLADAAVSIAEGEVDDTATSAAQEVVVVDDGEIEEGEIVEEAEIGVQKGGDVEAVVGQEIVPVAEPERIYLVPHLNESPPPEDQ